VLFLSWYYTHAFARSGDHPSRTALSPAGEGDAALPPLDPNPSRAAPPNTATHAASPHASPPFTSHVLTDEPDDPEISNATPAQFSAHAAGYARPSALDRRLSGSVFARSATPGAAATPPSAEIQSPLSSTLRNPAESAAPDPSGNLATLLKARTTPAVAAGILPTQRLLLPKGAFIDCTLETAIDSTLPGLTTCITAVDTFSVDGKVVLLERGTKLIGETRGEVQQGASRLFVLWTEARTPNGVIVNLDSPGTDELGRSGLPGNVNRHFIDRFGAAILISVINGAIQGATQRATSGSTVIYNPSAPQDVLTEVLRSTINIPPTITKHQGDRIQILVARDLDFRSVYALHAQ